MKQALFLAWVLACSSTAVAQTYSYDALWRPTRIAYDDGTVYELTYDASGNVTRKFSGPGSGGGGGGGCFIATAAYGSALDPHVEALRVFREEWLRPNPPGRAFIAAYEQVSPPIADWIREREAARTATRWALTPLVCAASHPRTALALLLAAGLALWARRRSRSAA